MVFALAIILPISIWGQAKESVAVMDMEGRGISTIEAATLTDRMRSELVSTGEVTVVERGQMQSILAEQDFQLTGCTSDECAVEIGQLLGVTKMIAGTVGKIGSTYTLDIRVIDIETGAISNTMTRDYRGEIDGLIREIEHISWELVGLRHPDAVAADLASGPSITLEEIANMRKGGASLDQANGGKKGGFGKLLMWTVLLAAAGGGGYYALVLAPDDGSGTGGPDGEPIGGPPVFPNVP